jgi:hypothetical protein
MSLAYSAALSVGVAEDTDTVVDAFGAFFSFI